MGAGSAGAVAIPQAYMYGITVVHSDAMPPMSFFGLNGEPKGFVIDYWKRWEEKTGVPVTFKLMNWKDGLEYVRKHDGAVHGGLYLTEDRLLYLDFTKEYFSIQGGLFVMKGSDITSMNDLKDRHVGVLEKGASQELVNRNYPYALIKSYPTVRDMTEALIEGKIEAVVADRPSIMYLGATYGAVKNLVSAQVLFKENLRAAVGKGRSELLGLVVYGMSLINEEDRYDILHRWFVVEEKGASKLMIVLGVSLVGLLIALGILFMGGRIRSSR